MALRALVVVLALALVAAASAATQKKANACLTAHHVLLKPEPAKTVTRFGVHVQSLESFSFHGVPRKVYDSGSLLFEPTAAAAAKAQHTLYSRLAAYEIKLSNGKVSPYRIRLNLRRTQAVIGNVVVLWNNYPQKVVAKTVVRGCLR